MFLGLISYVFINKLQKSPNNQKPRTFVPRYPLSGAFDPTSGTNPSPSSRKQIWGTELFRPLPHNRAKRRNHYGLSPP